MATYLFLTRVPTRKYRPPRYRYVLLQFSHKGSTVNQNRGKYKNGRILIRNEVSLHPCAEFLSCLQLCTRYRNLIILLLIRKRQSTRTRLGHSLVNIP
jgi:hypothetical protein